MFLNLAFYRFTRLSGELAELRAELRELAGRLGLKGTIILSPEGLNGSVAGEEPAARALQSHLRETWGLRELEFKESWSAAPPFGNLFVKLKRELVPLGIPEADPVARTGKRLPAPELKRWLDEKREFLLLDTRNDYEVAAGTFRGASTLGLRTFRELGHKIEEIPGDARAKPVVMFCTGGIRCEKATALAMARGFTEVFQLEGGILKYFEQCGDAHFDGECFVFDERRGLDAKLRARALTES